MSIENLGKLERIVSYVCMTAMMIPSACALYTILRSFYEDYKKSRKSEEMHCRKTNGDYVKKV